MKPKKAATTIDVVATEIADDPKLAELQRIVTIDQASEVAKFDPIQARATELVNEIKSTVYDINTTDGEDTAKVLRRRCVGMRTAADAVYKTWNRPVLDAQTEMRAIVASIVKLVEPVESELDIAIKAKEKVREDIRLAKIAAEQSRIAALRAKITLIASLPTAAAKATHSHGIQILVMNLDAILLGEENFEEFLEEATALHAEIRTQLCDMLQAAVDREEQAAALAAQALQLAAEREAQALATRRANAILEIRSYPLGAMGLDSKGIAQHMANLRAPTQDFFGEAILEATAAFESAVAYIKIIADTVAATELAAVRQRTAEADAEQRRREDEWAADLRQQQATASAVLFKHQQDAFAEEQRVAQEAQRVAREAIAQERRDLEAKEAAMLAPKVVEPVVVEPVVAVQAEPVTPSDPLVVESTSKATKENQRKAAGLLVAVRRTNESELVAIERLLDPEVHAALRSMHAQLVEEELLTEIPF